MNNVKVSIIIPIYNPGELLIGCLDSATNQSLEDIEIICIDDGSIDGSSEILKRYSQNDARFKIITQDNLGAGRARNEGIKNAEGEFIIFLDSDDWIESNMCELLYHHAKKLNADLVLFDALRHLENGNTKEFTHFGYFKEDCTTFTFDYHFAKEKVFNGYLGVIWSKFYKNSFLKDNNLLFADHKMFNDVEFHIKSLLLAKTIGYCPKVFYHYMKVGQASLQNTYAGTPTSMCFYDVLVETKEFLTNNGFMDEFRLDFLNYSLYYLKTKLCQMDYNYKQEFFIKIKNFLETLKITPEELVKISNLHIPFYIHVINSKDYYEFNIYHEQFDGTNIKIQNKLDFEELEQYTNKNAVEEYGLLINQVYATILEKNIHNFANDDAFSSLQCEPDEIAKYIAEVNKYFNELKMFNYKLINENEYLRQDNSKLHLENDELKKEINSSQLSKLKKKLIKR